MPPRAEVSPSSLSEGVHMHSVLRRVVVSVAAGIAAGALTLTGTPAHAAFDRDAPDRGGADPGRSLVVETEQGTLAGARSDQVHSFLGVPFAAAPVGDLRWQPPAPAPAWPGVRSAAKRGPECPQLSHASANEGCLNLNVFRPAGPAVGGAVRGRDAGAVRGGPAGDVPEREPLPGYVSGAPHGSDAGYIFPTPTTSRSEEPQRLSLEIVRYLGEFVKKGRPRAAGQATWPGVRSEQVMSQRLGGSTAISGREFDADHQCDLWNSFDYPWLSVNPSDLAREVGVGSP